MRDQIQKHSRYPHENHNQLVIYEFVRFSKHNLIIIPRDPSKEHHVTNYNHLAEKIECNVRDLPSTISHSMFLQKVSHNFIRAGIFLLVCNLDDLNVSRSYKQFGPWVLHPRKAMLSRHYALALGLPLWFPRPNAPTTKPSLILKSHLETFTVVLYLGTFNTCLSNN